MSQLYPSSPGRRALLGAGLALAASAAGVSQWLKEEAWFTEPDVGGEVNFRTTARGYVSRQLDGSRLWVTVNKSDKAEFYPQEGSVLVIPGFSGAFRREWVRTNILLGELGSFQLRLYQTTREANALFINYLREGDQTGNYTPFKEYQLQSENGFYLRDQREVIRRA